TRKIASGSAASAFSSTSQTCTRAPCSRKVLAMTRPMPAPPAVTRTRRPLAEVSMPPMITPPPAGFLEFQHPELADCLRPEAVVHFGPRQLAEARLTIDRA